MPYERKKDGRFRESEYLNINDFDPERVKARRPLRFSIDLNSQHSRTSQETDEDVCFPANHAQNQKTGIDFGELEEFVMGERIVNLGQEMGQEMGQQSVSFNIGRSSGAEEKSRNALKYTPKEYRDSKWSKLNLTDACDDVHEKTQVKTETEQELQREKSQNSGLSPVSDLPTRYSFYHTENDRTLHAPDLPTLVEGESWQNLMKNGKSTWWLDCTCPTDAELKSISKAFGIHPLTAEDVRMQEAREKVEMFPSYYFVSFHTFQENQQLEDHLELIKMYIVVFKSGVLTFKFSPNLHPLNVRRRARQLSDYVDVTPDWICYALIDDITDLFAPAIRSIEFQADMIDDMVFLVRLADLPSMLERIGECRKIVMTLMRLLANKADVIKMFASRCESYESVHSNMQTNVQTNVQPAFHALALNESRPGSEIALYLGDIQDHILTMFLSLSAYEKIFSRSENNYLAQIQVEGLASDLAFSKVLEGLTILATVVAPLNVITGMFGMNTMVPGKDGPNIYWFVGIVCFMFSLSVCVFFGFKKYIRREERMAVERDTEKESVVVEKRRTARPRAKSMVNYKNEYDYQY